MIAFLAYVDDPQGCECPAEEGLRGIDPLVARLQEKIRKIKRNARMEGEYMLFGELLNDEREEGRREGLAEGRSQGLMDGQMLLLKLLRAMQEDGRTAEISRLEEDPEFREEMYKRYGIR